jgi:hypothetical protein
MARTSAGPQAPKAAPPRAGPSSTATSTGGPGKLMVAIVPPFCAFRMLTLASSALGTKRRTRCGEAVRPCHLAAIPAYHTKTTLEPDHRLDGTLIVPAHRPHVGESRKGAADTKTGA